VDALRFADEGLKLALCLEMRWLKRAGDCHEHEVLATVLSRVCGSIAKVGDSQIQVARSSGSDSRRERKSGLGRIGAGLVSLTNRIGSTIFDLLPDVCQLAHCGEVGRRGEW